MAETRSESATERRLHVYPQEHPHDEVVLVGNRAALEALQRAVSDALGSGARSAGALVFAGDGEGYAVVVIPFEGGVDGWRYLAVPYTAEGFREHREEATTLADLWKRPAET